jgi:head-tail adaptor
MAMIWRDTLDLIAVTHSGPDDVVTETSRTVLAHKTGVVRTEFYAALSNNLMPTATFMIRSIEYDGEQKLRHAGKEYLIIRTYDRGDDIMELVCQAYDDVQPNLARLRDRVEIWHNRLVENSMHEYEPVPELVCSVMATVDIRGGGTAGVDDIVETTNDATVTIRYRPGITPDMWVVIGGERWDIRYIEDPHNRHETLVLYVERVTP